MLDNKQIETILINIRRRREQLQYSQEYLAAKLNMSQNCYSKTELNSSRLTLERFLRICQVLNVTPVSLLENNLPLD